MSDRLSPPSVELISVNVGLPAVIGMHRGKPVMSGIKKQPASGTTLTLDTLNLAGDRQADLRVHGGTEKAVYAYPFEHLARWSVDLERDPPFGPGSFGENLTVAGWSEDDVRIGDVWAWGDALIQVAQPRYPCYKLALATGRPSIARSFIVHGRTGWYFRVLRPGEVPVAGPIEVVERDPAGVTIMDAHRALVGDASREAIERVLAVTVLAASWRGALEQRLVGE